MDSIRMTATDRPVYPAADNKDDRATISLAVGRSLTVLRSPW